MSHTNNNTPAAEPANPGGAKGSVGSLPESDTTAQLAHELANLLDGSLRHLHLAIQTLSQTAPAEPSSDVAGLLNRLQTTDSAMQRMASLIHAWMKAAPQPRELFDQPQSLKQTLEQIIEIHRPAATEHGITLDLYLDDAASRLPAGPVFPVIANAILNSIEAIAAMPPRDRYEQSQVLVKARVELGRVYLTVTDNGPGLSPDMFDGHGRLRIGQSTKPQGHGLGLSLSQQVANNLGGTINISNNDHGGATLTLKYPVEGIQQTNQ